MVDKAHNNPERGAFPQCQGTSLSRSLPPASGPSPVTDLAASPLSDSSLAVVVSDQVLTKETGEWMLERSHALWGSPGPTQGMNLVAL